MPLYKKIFESVDDGFRVDFGEVLDLTEFSEPEANFLCNFPMTRKKVFHSIKAQILDDLIQYSRSYPDLLEKYAIVKSIILERCAPEDPEEKMSEEAFIEAVAENIIRDEQFQHIIRDRVNREYTITIETKAEKDELQFKDSYAKLLVCVASMCRVIAPFVCAYMEGVGMKKEATLSVRLFTEVFNVFDVDEHGEAVDLSAKVARFISSAVENTIYSDKVIWEYLRNLSVTPQSLAVDLFRKAVRDTIPKMDVNKSVVAFLYVVIKQQIHFTFTQNIKVTFKPISSIRTEGGDGNVSPFTRMEMRLVASNEMTWAIEKEAIKNFIEKHRRTVSADELEYYEQVIKPNPFQLKMVSYAVNSDERINVQLCNRSEYAALVAIAVRMMERKKMLIMPRLITAIPKPKETRRNMNRSKLISDVMLSNSYQNLLDRFPLVRSRLDDSRTIVGLVGDVMNTTFEPILHYGEESEDPAWNERLDTDNNQKAIMQDILSFLLRF
jgi:hypothetical protein